MAKGDNSPPPAVDEPVPMAHPPIRLSRQQTQSQLAPRSPRGPEGRTGAEHPLPHTRTGQAQTGWKQGHPASSEHPERPKGCHSTMESGPHRPLASPSFLQTRGTSLPEGHGLATDAPCRGLSIPVTPAHALLHPTAVPGCPHHLRHQWKSSWSGDLGRAPAAGRAPAPGVGSTVGLLFGLAARAPRCHGVSFQPQGTLLPTQKETGHGLAAHAPPFPVRTPRCV